MASRREVEFTMASRREEICAAPIHTASLSSARFPPRMSRRRVAENRMCAPTHTHTHTPTHICRSQAQPGGWCADACVLLLTKRWDADTTLYRTYTGNGRIVNKVYTAAARVSTIQSCTRCYVNQSCFQLPASTIQSCIHCNVS